MQTLLPLLDRIARRGEGGKHPKETNGRPVAKEAVQPRTTMHGWPMGKPLPLPEDWRMTISPLAKAKLDVWHRGSRGLEVSGYAILDKPVKANPAQPYTFHVKDMLLVCAIEESTGGYTEMPAELRAKAMMEIVKSGNRPNAVGWWHQHPVYGWSGIDVNTLRQRVHEMGMSEVLQCFAFVLTPGGIRARWDQSGPNEKDNVYVDQIPVELYMPELEEEIEKAQAQIEEMVAQHPRFKDQPEEKPVNGDVPQATWKRRVIDRPFVPAPTSYYAELDDPYDADDYLSDLDEIVLAEIIREKLSPNESEAEFLCRRDSDTIVEIDACVSCPFGADCFDISQADYNDTLRKWMEAV